MNNPAFPKTFFATVLNLGLPVLPWLSSGGVFTIKETEIKVIKESPSFVSRKVLENTYWKEGGSFSV